MDNIRISIITITFNSGKTLQRTIQSVINQNYDNLEYIIVDGGSTDNTLKIIEKHKKHISKCISEKDKGISDAFNKGISIATGEIIGIINSDDMLAQDALYKLAKAYESDIDVYRGKIILWDTESNTKVEEIPSMHFKYNLLNTSICHPGTFIRRDAYLKYGTYNIKYKFVMDYDLLLRFEREGAKFKFIDNIMAQFTLGGITFTSDSKTRIKEIVSVIKANGANSMDVVFLLITENLKLILKKFVRKNIILKLKHKQINNAD